MRLRIGRWGVSATLAGIVGLFIFMMAIPSHAQEGRQLVYGEQVQGRIIREDARQVYFFEARRGDVVSVEMTPLEGTLDPVLVLTDNAGNVLASSDDVGGTLGAAIETIQIPEDNYYFVIATRYGYGLGVTEGTFELSLQRVGVVSAAGVYLSFGDSVVGSIDGNAPSVRYVFEAERGDIIDVQMRRISGNLDSYVAVMNEKGEIIATNDDLTETLDAAIEGLLILEPGFYTIMASRFGEEAGDSRGSYVLTLETAPTSGQGLTPDGALLLRYGTELQGEIDAETPFRYYTFGAGRGDIVTITMDRKGGNLDPFLVLANEQGIQLVEDDDSGPSNNAVIQSYIIPESGTYFLQAARFDREAGVTAGSYLIRLEGVTGEAPVVSPGTLTILYGSSIPGEITNEATTATYAFLGNEADIVTIDLGASSGNLDPYLLLFTSNSVQLAEDDDSGPGKDARIASFTLPANDIYYIVATRFEYEAGDTTGQFTLSLARLQP